MKQQQLKIFINKILATEVRQSERYPSIVKEMDIAKKYKYGYKDTELLCNAHSSFRVLCIRIAYYKGLQDVVRHLTEAGVYISPVGNNPNEDYIVQFQEWIDEAKKTLKTLRPYVLELTKDWTDERKSHEFTPETTPYLRHWFLDIIQYQAHNS